MADAVNGRPVRNTEALANPEALDAIAALPELQPQSPPRRRGAIVARRCRKREARATFATPPCKM